MHKVKIVIYHGILLPLSIEPPKCLELLQQLVTDLTKLKIKFPLDVESEALIEVKQIVRLPGNKKVIWNVLKKYAQKEIFLKWH